MKRRHKFNIVRSILIALIFLTFIISLNLGSFKISPIDVIKTFFGQGSRNHELVIFNLRLPRIIIGILVGSALAIAGAILQGVTKNDLADSGILGINSGDALFLSLIHILRCRRSTLCRSRGRLCHLVLTSQWYLWQGCIHSSGLHIVQRTGRYE